MKSRFLFFCAAMALTAYCADAREATLFLRNHNRKGSEIAGLWTSHFPSGATSRIWDKQVHWACLSPDGRRIGFVTNDTLYAINIDGTGLIRLLTANDFDGAFHSTDTRYHWQTIQWAEAGIMWVANNKIYRYIVETNKLTVALDLTEIGTPCGGKVKEALFYSSRDGLRVWSRKIEMTPHNVRTANLSDHTLAFLESDKSKSRGYTRDDLGCFSHRTLRPFIQFSADFSDYTVVWDHQWGHGRGMTANGSVCLINHGYHRSFCVYAPQDGARVTSIYSWENKYDPPYPDGFEGNALVQCINNDSLLVAQSRRCMEDNSPNCVDAQPVRAFFFNWRSDKHYGEFELPILSAWLDGIDVWDGPLPTLSNEPYIGVTPNELTFNYDGKTQPAPQTVTVSNIGKKTLGKVSISVAPAGATWLAVAVPDGGGNTQTLSNSINAANLNSDEATATVTVSGGGASNSVTYTVSCYKGALIAPPTELAVAEAGDSLLDATLTWKDNAANETGYRIERKKEGSAWEEIAQTGADATTYTDKRLDYHTKYFYRLRAFVESGQDTRYSQYSKEQFVTIAGIAWVRIQYPTQGDAVRAGSKTTIQWEANNCDVAVIKLSTDDGLSWTEVTQKGGIEPTDPNWGSFEWQVPEADVTTARLYIGLYPGDLEPFAVTGAFTISPDAPAKNHTFPRTRCDGAHGLSMRPNGTILAWTNSIAATVSVYTVGGKRIARHALSPGHSAIIPTAGSGAGLYICELRGGDGRLLYKNRSISAR